MNTSELSAVVSGVVSGLAEAGLFRISTKNGSREINIDGPKPLSEAVPNYSSDATYYVNNAVADANTMVSPGDEVFAASRVRAGR